MRYFLALFLIASLLPSVAKADLIPDNSHGMTNCVSVENIGDYPEYDFVWQRSYRFESTQKITSAEMVCEYSGGYSLYAIQKSDWDKVTYPEEDPDCPECGTGANWIDEPKNEGLFIPSGYSLSLDPYISDTNSAVKQAITVHIDSVSATEVAAHTASTLSTDSDDEPVEAETGGNLLTNSALALIAAGLFGLGYMMRAWKKK